MTENDVFYKRKSCIAERDDFYFDAQTEGVENVNGRHFSDLDSALIDDTVVFYRRNPVRM